MATQNMNLTTLALATLAAAGLTACSSGSSDGSADAGGDTGTLSVSLMDAPVFDAEEVWICITQVNVKPAEGTALEFPLEDADGDATACDGEQLDLLTLTSPTEAAPLIDGEPVEAGAYEWMELEVDAARPGMGQGDADGDYDSYVVDSTGGQHVLRVPSGSVRLVSGFTVTAGQHTRFTIDWDLRSGLTNPVGMEGYLLRPALRLIDEAEYGTLSGTVSNELITGASGDFSCALDDPDLDVGNVVYLYALEGPDETLEPDDNDGVAPDAYATIEAEPNTDSTAYVFETIVAPGDYRIAFTCQGDRDDPEVNENDPNEADDEQPEWDVEFLDPDGEANITIVEDETTTVSFSTLPTT